MFFIFYFLSGFLSFVLSLTDWSLIYREISFIAFDNYIKLVTDRHFVGDFVNTIAFCFWRTVGLTFVGLALALLLNVKIRGRGLFRALFFMPCVFSALVIGYIFSYLLTYRGILNQMLRGIGLPMLAQDWLGKSHLTLASCIAVDIWMWSGFVAAIFLAALQTVPDELVEAAIIDGASASNVFRHVKLPFLMASLSFVIIINVIGGIKIFDLIWALTNGGPGFASEVLSIFTFFSLMIGRAGFASAVGFVQFVLTIIITIGINVFFRKKIVEL